MADHTSSTNLSENHTTNRRRLLLGAGTTALAASAALITPAIANPVAAEAGNMSVPVSVANDPAHRAFLLVRDACDAADAHRGPEEEYELVFDYYMATEDALAATPCRSVRDLHAKIQWLAEEQQWESGNCFYGSDIGISLLRDVERMTGRTLSRKGRS